MRTWFSRGAAALASILFARAASASPEDVIGYGPRSTAMGGTGVAHSEGYEAAYTNPALLSMIREQKLALGVEEVAFDLKASGAGLPGTIGYDPMHSVIIGADIPNPLRGVLTDRIGAAIALSTPTNVIVRGQILYPEVPQFSLLPTRTQSVSVRAGLGIDVGWGLRIGAGFAALAQLDGSAVVATDSTGKVGATVQDQLIATYSPTIGVAFDLPLREKAKTRLGFTYRGPLAARFDVTIDASKLSSLNIPILNIAGLAQYDPAELNFEAARQDGPLTVAVGATFKRWSSYPGPLEPTISCSSTDPGCGALVPPSITYKNTWVPRVGGEYAIEASKAMRLLLRAGVFYEPSPMPANLPSSKAYSDAANATVDVPTRYFDANRIAITLGYGVTLRDPLPPITVDLFGQMHVLMPRTIASDAPQSATGNDDSVGKVSGTVLAAGLIVGVKF
jgi:long-chain fatty acid transport protein